MPLFLSPFFLFAIAAAAIPVVLHLLKREPEPRVKFSAVALLRQAPVERSSTRRLRQIVLLMLRVSALILLALAFARPFFPSPAAAAARNATIVLLDTSYSMSAPGRFARAQQLARDAVNGAPAGDDVGVVTFADRAELVAPPSSGRAAALAAIDSTTAGAGGTRYLEAVNAAGRALGGRHGTVVVVTDLQAGGWDAGDHATVPESARVEVRDVGALPDNLAVIGLRSDGDRAIVTVKNDSQRAREVTVRLTVDGRVAGSRSASIAPHGAGDVVFSGVTGGEAAAGVDDRDGLQADNVRYARLTGASRAAVLAVTATGDLDRDAFYVHQALAAGGTDRGVPGVTGVAASQLGSWTSARMASFGSVLLLSTRGLDRRGRELITSHVAAGGGLLIAVGQDVDGDVAADVLGASARLRVQPPDDRRAPQPLSLAPADIRHPIFQPFGPAAASLGLVRFARAATVSAAGAGCQTLAKFTSGEAALIDCGIGDGHAVVVSSDLDNRWNDFPLHASFLPFMHETVRYLSSARAQATAYLVGEVPAGISPVPGIVTLGEAGAPGSRRAVINVDPGESEPARISPEEFGSAIARLKDAGAAETQAAESGRESSQHVWQYLLGAMLVLLAVEGAVAGRTV
jgi:hypothetical protein